MKTMKKMFLSALAVAALAFVGCTKDATTDLNQDNGGAAVELHTFTFEAEIAQPSRTSLVDPGTGSSYVCWSADDVVAIITDEGIYQATIASGAGTPYATYTVSLPEGVSPHTAVYPYKFPHDAKSTVAVDSGNISLSFPVLQTYKAGSVFGDDENVMVGSFTEGANGLKCAMKSVMGAIELKFKGSQKVEGITVKTSQTGKQRISGTGTINPSTKAVTIGSTPTSFCLTNLAVPEQVTLSSSEATSFYVLLPAGTYEALQIGVMTEDGSYVRTATKAHTVKAGEILPINCGDLDAMIDEASAVNLSAKGCANCYVVVPDGAPKTYVFDTKMVDGTDLTKHVNSYLKNRYITGTYKNHCTNEDILAHMVHILWTEEAGVAYDIQFDKVNGKVYFKNDGRTLGNARMLLSCDVIKAHTPVSQVTRPDNNIIWGWQIWATCSEPAESIAVNGNNIQNTDDLATIATRGKIGLMDRNLGATWTATTVAAIQNITAQQAADAVGLYYQFGNMVPQTRQKTFVPEEGDWKYTRAKYTYGFADYTQVWTSSSGIKASYDDNLQLPLYRYAGKYTPTVAGTLSTNYGGSNYNWISMDIIGGGAKSGVAEADKAKILWDGSGAKTNYDPCPVGWQVPDRGDMYQAIRGAKKQLSALGMESEANIARYLTKFAPQINGKVAGGYISYNGVDAAFYPYSGYHGAKTVSNPGNGYYWACGYYNGYGAADPYKSKNDYNMASFEGVSATSTWGYDNQFWLSNGYQVRCVKEKK